MATVNKDFKIKSGLIVEGTTATVNGYDILTKKQGDQDYIVNLIGGTATSQNTPDTVVKRDSNGDFSAGTITADLVGDVDGEASTVASLSNHTTADLSEDPNGPLYFTDTRAVNAVTGLNNTDYYPLVEKDGKAGVYKATVASQLASQSINGSGISQSTGSTEALGIDRSTVDTWYDAAGTAAALIEDGQTDGTHVWSSYKTSTEIGLAQAAAELHADNAVAALVDSAPALLDTLNELAAAIGDDANFASSIGTSIGEKVAKSGDTMTGELILSADPSQALAAATKQYVDAQASDAYNDAILTASGDATTKANAAEQNAKDYADALDTDDIAEGVNNLYFTNARVENAIVDPLTLGTQTNISVTYNTNTGAYDFVAENGVADSTTDDLTEGVNNLYFQNSRVYNAIEGSNIQPQSVDITWVRREEATWTGVPTASTATVHSFGTNKGSVKYLVRVISGPNSHVTEVLATTDSNNNVAVVEYGTVYTSLDPLATVTVVWNSGTSQYDLNVTTAQNNSEVLVAATLLAYND